MPFEDSHSDIPQPEFMKTIPTLLGILQEKVEAGEITSLVVIAEGTDDDYSMFMTRPEHVFGVAGFMAWLATHFRDISNQFEQVTSESNEDPV